MSKTLKETQLTTRAARERLGAGIYFRSLDRDVHLGYRKGARTGRWFVRWRVGSGYRQHQLGGADDVLSADGILSLSFDQALRAARDHVEAARRPEPEAPSTLMPTVKIAAGDHANALEQRQASAGRSVSRDCRSRFRTHVDADPIASIELPSLTDSDLIEWRKRLGTKGLKLASVQRIVNDLRAALNEAWKTHRKLLDGGYRTAVIDGLAPLPEDPGPTETRPNIILSDIEVHRLLEVAKLVDAEDGWDGHLYRMIVALAATGGRFSQLMRCRVWDFIAEKRRLMIPDSWKGKKKKRQGRTVRHLGLDAAAIIEEAVASRVGEESLLLRWGFRQGKGLRWEKHELRPWRPSELTEPFAKVVARAALPKTVTAYALRHTSITRGLRMGLPIRLVAAMHNTSSEMIEEYYSAHIVDALDEIAQRVTIDIPNPKRLDLTPAA
jgi:integrase